jgi:hypothetical protein
MASTTLMNTAIAVTGVNIILILALLNVYVKNYRKIRTTHTTGLLLFAGLFMIQNLVLLFYGLTMAEIYAKGVGFFLLVFAILQAVAFTILNWITWK